MTPVLHAVGRVCVRRHRLVLAAWLVLVVALGFTARTIELQTATTSRCRGPAARRATDVLEDRFPSQANGTNPVVFAAQQGQAHQRRQRSAVDKTVKALEKDSLVASVTAPRPAGAGRSARTRRSASRR